MMQMSDWRSALDMSTLRAALAEFIGTGIFVFIGVVTVVNTREMIDGDSTVVQLGVVAFAFGLAVALAVAAVVRVSGAHVNPAVTLAALATGNIELPRAAMYMVAQVGGAVAGSALVVLVVPGDGGSLGATSLAPDVSIGMGLVTEITITFFLVFVIYATAVDPRASGAQAPLLIGLTVAVGILAGGGLTGGSMNPARSFGPALVGGEWDDHWVYWVGPIVGGVLAAVVYSQLFLEDRDKQLFLVEEDEGTGSAGQEMS
jgi:aquaporin TIP